MWWRGPRGKGKKKETKNGKGYDYRTDSVTFAKIQAPATATYKHTPSTPHIRPMFCRTIGAIRGVCGLFFSKKKRQPKPTFDTGMQGAPTGENCETRDRGWVFGCFFFPVLFLEICTFCWAQVTSS